MAYSGIWQDTLPWSDSERDRKLTGFVVVSLAITIVFFIIRERRERERREREREKEREGKREREKNQKRKNKLRSLSLNPSPNLRHNLSRIEVKWHVNRHNERRLWLKTRSPICATLMLHHWNKTNL